MLNEHLGMLKRFAAVALKRSGLDFSYYYEDVLGQAFLAFSDALRSYDDSYGTKFSTHLWQKLRHHVNYFIIKEQKQRYFVKEFRNIEETLRTRTPRRSGLP